MEVMEEDEEVNKKGRGLSDLPDELLENIFSRLNPYLDLENVRVTCKRFRDVGEKVIHQLQTNFEENLIQGKVTSVRLSPEISETGQIIPPGSWMTERFGHMACYYDKCLYIVGGTTHTPTTFNDMWMFDLGKEKWQRVLASGQYPTPKALGSGVVWKDNLVIFGGWSHPPAYPLMQPWRIYDELHIYNFTSNKWTLLAGSGRSPWPTAGHSASIMGDKMVTFGGRIFDQAQQAYPLSDAVWVYDFNEREWTELRIEGNRKPSARYGHSQVTIGERSILVVGGCGGPNQVFSDVWLLTVEGRVKGRWEQITVANADQFTPTGFHYHGCKVGNSVVFLERVSSIPPFLAFLQYDAQHTHPLEQQGFNFEPGRPRQRYFHTRRVSATAQTPSVMSIYSLDISQTLETKTAKWVKEDTSSLPSPVQRPNERLLYSMVQGRAELVLFGGFYKDPSSPRCRVSSDIFIIKQLQKTY